MKKCGNRNCPLPQPLKPSQFNKSVASKDGLQSYCKTCQSMTNSRLRKNPDYSKMKERRYRLKHPDRWHAIHRVRYAIKAGHIKRGKCEVCGKTRTEMFIEEPYERYTRPWSKAPKPRWFCHAHHPRRSSADNTITYEEFDFED